MTHDEPDALFAEAVALERQGQLDAAIRVYRQLLALLPDRIEILNNLAVALGAAGQSEEAVKYFRRALDLWPDFAEIHNNFGFHLAQQKRLDEAVACYLRCLELKPDYAEGHNNLASVWKAQGMLDEALGAYRKALALRPDSSRIFSNYLCALRYHPDAGATVLAAAHAEYERRYAAPLRAAWRPHANSRQPERRLRLGSVSPLFSAGPVGSFLIRAWENLDRGECDIFAYSDRIAGDALTERFASAATRWRPTVGLSVEAMDEQIRADQIDILFDLAGHGRGESRLAVFARRPAPIQITWLDSVGTTGLSAIDYVLADRHLIPPGSDAGYTERVLRMPESYVTFEPSAEAPPVGPLPALLGGQVTFASFAHPAKLNVRLFHVWAQILARVPGSRLLLKYFGLESQGARLHLQRLFQASGVDPRRVELQGASPMAEYLAEHNRVDISLDTFPHNGGLTSCDSLWMGVPVVTCPGETFASRQSLSYLSTTGLTETIADDLGGYAEIAVQLAADLPRLAEIRAGLRQRVAQSPLGDGKRFAGDLLATLREAWRRWCAEP